MDNQQAEIYACFQSFFNCVEQLEIDDKAKVYIKERWLYCRIRGRLSPLNPKHFHTFMINVSHGLKQDLIVVSSTTQSTNTYNPGIYYKEPITLWEQDGQWSILRRSARATKKVDRLTY